MNPINYNYSTFNSLSNPYYYTGFPVISSNMPGVQYYPSQISEETNPSDNAAKTLGLAALLQIAAKGIKSGSAFLSKRLSAGKEFTSFDNVKKVEQYMLNKNKLNVNIGYIDDINKVLYQNKYGIGNDIEAVAKGQNAFFSRFHKLAVAPKSKPSLILHELGHAVNAKAGITKHLQKIRHYAYYAPAALLIANGLFADKNDGKKTFIERNAGVLGFCAFLPTIIEESIASLRGIKAAKKVLGNPSSLKILKKNYALALGTYILAGVGLGIASKQTLLWNGSSEQTNQF